MQDVLQSQAAHAINLALTARNWLVGYYIVEFEQHGEDRAKYGEKMLNRLAQSINKKGFEPRRLREYRQLYIVYPSLGGEIVKYIQSSHLIKPSSEDNQIWRMPSAKLLLIDNQKEEKWQMPSAKLEDWCTTPDRLFYRLNFSNLMLLAKIDDTQRTGGCPPALGEPPGGLTAKNYFAK